MSELHARAGEDRSPDPRDPKPECVRVLHAAKGESAVPRTWSADMIVFDHEPADEELVAVLGQFVTIQSSLLREGHHVRVRWRELPMRWIVPWMLLVFAGVTTLVFWIEGASPIGIAILCLGGFVGLPALLAVCWALNRHARSRPDLSRIDFACRHMVVPKSALSVEFEELIFCVDLRRWVRTVREVRLVRQLGVVVHPSGPHHRSWAYHTFALDEDNLLQGIQRVRRWDRLLEEIGRPVRKIRLSLSESRALGDAPDGDS